MARATIVTWRSASPPRARCRAACLRSYSSRSAGPEVAGDQDRVVGQLRRIVAARLADQEAQQAVGDVVEVDQPLAQIGVAGVADPDAGLLLHAPHRRLGATGRCRSPRGSGAANRCPGRTCGRSRAPRAARRRRSRWSPASGRASSRSALVDRGSRRASSACGFSASSRVTSTRGSCSHAWPIATPSTSRVPVQPAHRGRRRRRCRHTWLWSISSPEPNISARIEAMICIASISSSA